MPRGNIIQKLQNANEIDIKFRILYQMFAFLRNM